MPKRTLRPVTFAACLLLLAAAAAAAVPPRFQISYARSLSQGPVTGRLILIISKRDQPEPRLAISPLAPALFAIDLHQLTPDQTVTIDESALGYPMRLSELPAGEYYVQATPSDRSWSVSCTSSRATWMTST